MFYKISLFGLQIIDEANECCFKHAWKISLYFQ